MASRSASSPDRLVCADLPSGACPVVDSESGAIIWYVSPDTLKVAGDTSKELAIALSKPIADLYETVQSKETLKPPVTISPNTNMTEMVKLIAEVRHHLCRARPTPAANPQRSGGLHADQSAQAVGVRRCEAPDRRGFSNQHDTVHYEIRGVRLSFCKAVLPSIYTHMASSTR